MRTSAVATEHSPDSFQTRIVIDRNDEAKRVVEFISHPGTRLAVLHGGPNCGKSILVRSFVIPSMPEASKVYYGIATSDLPPTVSGLSGELPLMQALSQPATIFIDEFDRILSAGGKARMEKVGALFSSVQNGELAGKLVLILRRENLPLLLVFRTSAPDLLDKTYEIRGLPVEEHIRQLGASGDVPIAYAQELIRTLREDLDKFGTSGSGEIADAVDCGFRYYKRDSLDRSVTLDDYADAGFLPGILRRCLDVRMASADQKFGNGAGQITAAIATEVVEAQRFGRATDFGGIATRLGVPADLCETVLAWVSNGGRLLKVDAAGGFRLIPPELGRVLEMELEPQWRELGDAREIVSDGIRGKSHLGTLIPKEKFDQVNRVRTRLKTVDEETALLALSAIHLPGGNQDALYWLGRLPDHDAQVSVLIEALFSEFAIARANSAELLAGFEDEEVRGQLYRRALEDRDPTVRARAITSLAGMRNEELWPALEKEAKDPSSPFRENAIEAMSLCHCVSCVATLEQIVGEPAELGLRAACIRTLGAMNFPAAVDALVRIGLDDEDVEDRTSAAQSLASLNSPELISRALDTTRTARLKIDQSGWEILEQPLGAGARWVLAILLAILNFFLHGLALIPQKRYGWAGAFFAAEIGCILSAQVVGVFAILLFLLNWILSHFVATSFVLQNSQRRTRALGGVLFWFCAGSFLLFHGSAHALMGRWKRAASLLLVECAGLALFGIAYYSFYDYQTSRHGLERVFYSFFWLYAGAGAVLFFVSMWLDIKEIFYERFLMADRAEARQRKADLLSSVLATPLGTQAALSMAESAEHAPAHWARTTLIHCGSGLSHKDLLSRFENLGAAVPAFLRRTLARNRTEETLNALTRLWDSGASPALRRHILSVFLTNPSQQSLERVAQRRRDLDAWGKWKYRFTAIRYPISLWPKTLRWGVLLMVPFLFYALCEAVLSAKSPAHNLVHHMRTALDHGSDEAGVKMAQFLAKSYPEPSAVEIIELYRNAPAGRAIAHRGLRESLSALVCANLPETVLDDAHRALAASGDALRTYVEAARDICPENTRVAGVLIGEAGKTLSAADTAPEDLRLAVRGLEAVGTAEAVGVLKEFVVRPSTATRLREVNTAIRAQENKRREVELKMDAVDSLIRIGSSPAYQALQQIAEELPSEDLRQQVYKRVRSIPTTDPLNPVQSAFDRADYERAVKEGLALLAPHTFDRLKPAEQNRLYLRLGESNYRLSMDANPSERDNYEREAINYFTRLLSVDTENIASRSIAEIRNTRAERWRVKGGRGDLDRALSEADAGIRIDPSYAEIHGTRGAILLDKQDVTGALAAFAKATQLDKRFAWAYGMQANVYLEHGDFDSAERLAASGIAADPNYSWCYYLLSRSYTEAGKGTEAIGRFEELENKYRDVYWPGRQLANLYHDYWPKQDGAGLKKSYEKWLELNKRFAKDLDPATRANHDANFLESQFTTGHYQDVIRDGVELGKRLKDDPDFQMPVVLLTYAAARILDDPKTAREQLDLFAAALQKVPIGHKTPWEYSGTLTHLERANFQQKWAKPLINLITGAHKMKDGEAMPKGVIEENRRTL